MDAVVLDDKGRPVRGLTREDFVVEEDGQPQEIVSFEAFVAEAAPLPATATSKVLATNEVEHPGTSRAFTFVLDDLGMTHSDGVAARTAVTTFLGRSVRDGDELTLATTSGDAWWSARLPEGRDDLLAVAARLKGRAPEPSMSFDSMSDYEAFWIHNRDDGAGGQVLQRVVDRWLESQVCLADPRGRAEACRQMARARRPGSTTSGGCGRTSSSAPSGGVSRPWPRCAAASRSCCSRRDSSRTPRTTCARWPPLRAKRIPPSTS